MSDSEQEGEQNDSDLQRKYGDICLDLNMDETTKKDAWENFEKIKSKFTLEVRPPQFSPFYINSFFCREAHCTGWSVHFTWNVGNEN